MTPITCKPRLDELRPAGDGGFGRAESEGVAAPGVDVHLGGDAGLSERRVVDERVLHGIDGIIFRLKEDVGGVPFVT
jgi:hypothetical protein